MRQRWCSARSQWKGTYKSQIPEYYGKWQDLYSYSNFFHFFFFYLLQEVPKSSDWDIIPSQDRQPRSRGPWASSSATGVGGTCASLHSGAPCGQNPSSGGPSLPKGTSEDWCWQREIPMQATLSLIVFFPAAGCRYE